jgi:hypothetical protein
MEEELTFLKNVTAPSAKECEDTVQAAAEVLSFFHIATPVQAIRHNSLNVAFAECLKALVLNTAPGSERSTAISRLREARMWANMSVALAGDEDLSAAVVNAHAE